MEPLATQSTLAGPWFDGAPRGLVRFGTFGAAGPSLPFRAMLARRRAPTHTAANGRSPTRLARNVSCHFLAIANLIKLFNTLWLPQLAVAVLRSATGHRLEEK
jgi:hypothetical protein